MSTLTPTMPITAVPVEIMVTITFDPEGPTIIVPDHVSVVRGGNVMWLCATPGDLCLSFSNSVYPFALEIAFGNGAGPTLGPFPMSGHAQEYSYTLGWRQDATQPWIFTDPVVVVENPSKETGA